MQGDTLKLKNQSSNLSNKNMIMSWTGNVLSLFKLVALLQANRKTSGAKPALLGRVE